MIKDKNVIRKIRFMQSACLFFIIVGTILCGGNEITFEAVWGFVMVIIGALYWTFQDEIKLFAVSEKAE